MVPVRLTVGVGKAATGASACGGDTTVAGARGAATVRASSPLSATTGDRSTFDRLGGGGGGASVTGQGAMASGSVITGFGWAGSPMGALIESGSPADRQRRDDPQKWEHPFPIKRDWPPLSTPFGGRQHNDTVGIAHRSNLFVLAKRYGRERPHCDEDLTACGGRAEPRS